MKRIITIIVCCSLFVPYAAKMMAYVECSFVLLSNSNPDFCDCNLVVTSDILPLDTNTPDRQKEILIKADWKYVIEASYHLPDSYMINSNHLFPTYDSAVSLQQLSAVFHPPRC